MKRRLLLIRVIDHRKDPPEKYVMKFTNHKNYLRKMGELMSEPRAHLGEMTESEVTIYPENQHGLFE